MTTPSGRFLRKLFAEHLNFTPTPSQILSFEKDLTRVSPSLMQASILEVKNSGAMTRVPPREARAAIFGVYNRKLAEQSRMFPVFHIFETSFRSLLAVELEAEYGGVPDWWRPVELSLRQNIPPVPLVRVSGKAMSQDGHKALVSLIKSIMERRGGSNTLSNAKDGYDLFAIAYLQHIQSLAIEHWGAITRSFRTSVRGKPPVTKTQFNDYFAKIRDVRNEVYHHNSTSDMNRVVAIIEDMLDRVDINLAFSLRQVTASTPRAFTLTVLPEHRHIVY